MNRTQAQGGLPRRRRSFADVAPSVLREMIRPLLGADADGARFHAPAQGINNQTYLVEAPDGSGLVIKLRPRAASGVRNSPQWPRYTQRLFGPTPNGGLSTICAVSDDLTRHGLIRVPRIFLVDESLLLTPAPYFIGERLSGDAFDWEASPLESLASRQLGEHLGRVHADTAGASFGIYACRLRRLDDWWPCFAGAYRTLLDELARTSEVMRAMRPALEAALVRAVASGPPPAAALICADQNPTHYLRDADGGIGGMIDVEAHLWAAPEYELAMVETWARDPAALRAGYERHRPWPGGMDEVRPAYWFCTWMEWIYCVQTLLHDPEKAAALEAKLDALCRAVMK